MTTTQSDEICLVVPLSDLEAWNLAQFLKRVGYAEFRSNAVDDEAYRMQSAAEKLGGILLLLAIVLASKVNQKHSVDKTIKLHNY